MIERLTLTKAPVQGSRRAPSPLHVERIRVEKQPPDVSAQPPAASFRWESMETLIWFDVGPDYGVLEVDEAITAPGPALELHLLIDRETGMTVAWWSSDGGAWLRGVMVADA
jgi:hypothetical protein